MEEITTSDQFALKQMQLKQEAVVRMRAELLGKTDASLQNAQRDSEQVLATATRTAQSVTPTDLEKLKAELLTQQAVIMESLHKLETTTEKTLAKTETIDVKVAEVGKNVKQGFRDMAQLVKSNTCRASSLNMVRCSMQFILAILYQVFALYIFVRQLLLKILAQPRGIPYLGPLLYLILMGAFYVFEVILYSELSIIFASQFGYELDKAELAKQTYNILKHGSSGFYDVGSTAVNFVVDKGMQSFVGQVFQTALNDETTVFRPLVEYGEIAVEGVQKTVAVAQQVQAGIQQVQEGIQHLNEVAQTAKAWTSWSWKGGNGSVVRNNASLVEKIETTMLQHQNNPRAAMQETMGMVHAFMNVMRQDLADILQTGQSAVTEPQMKALLGGSGTKRRAAKKTKKRQRRRSGVTRRRQMKGGSMALTPSQTLMHSQSEKLLQTALQTSDWCIDSIIKTVAQSQMMVR